MNRSKSKKPGVESIDQILEKIKSAINEDTKHLESQSTEELSSDTNNEDPEVLELTSIVSNTKAKTKKATNEIEGESFDLISQHVQKFTRKLNFLMQGNYVVSEKEVREIFKETLRPYLKSWLNNNLQDIVKEVLEVEVKKIFKKLYNT
jgi:cell pole-organizing protein PopZ